MRNSVQRACASWLAKVGFRLADKADVMIQNDAQLQQAIEQIESLYRALNSLRSDILPKNPRTFAG
jgi:hypothetical protein